MLPILEQTPKELKAWFVEHGLPGYRAAQVRRQLFEKRVGSFNEMTDLPVALRDELSTQLTIWNTQVVTHQKSPDGTEKLLLGLADGHRIECVLLRNDKHHRTICISTQVGCAMGCAFCASGMDGLVRNLTTGEIVEQMLQLQRLLDVDERLSHIVVMGMGEPLANLDRLLSALATAGGDDGLGIGARRITISTVGLPNGIRRLAEANRQYHLAVSLHAPNDRLRNELIAANREFGIQAILTAADEYFETTGRRVTFEYVLLSEVNDRSDQARQLVTLLQGRPVLINVIPYNRVAGLPFRTPSVGSTNRFVDILTQAGINVIVRRLKGDRIDAACGQLRRREANSTDPA